jgi:hypothetical protein
VHGLVAESGTPLLSLGFNDWRDAAFCWVAQLLQTILNPCPTIERTTMTSSQQTMCLKNTAPLDPAWCNTHTSYLLIRLKHIPMAQGVLRPCSISADKPCDDGFTLSKFQDKLSVSRLADALRALRMSARKETKGLMCKSEHVGYYVVSLDHLKRLSEDRAARRMRRTQWTSTHLRSGRGQAVRTHTL